MKQKAVFFDKDGTLIEDVPYNVDPTKIRLAYLACDSLKALHQSNFGLYIVTNQSGMAMNMFAAEDVQRVRREIERQLAVDEIPLAGFYYCPHHPAGTVAPLAIACQCRKPMPGLILQAGREHHLSLESSWMVGDILDDIEAGHRAGCRSILVDCGNENIWDLSADVRRPDYVAPDLWGAVRHILSCEFA